MQIHTLLMKKGYTNAANTLNIATADDTKIVDKNEKKNIKGDLDRMTLSYSMVYQQRVSCSNNTYKVVVLGENEIAL